MLGQRIAQSTGFLPLNIKKMGSVMLDQMTPWAKISWPLDFLVAEENMDKHTHKIHVL